MTTLPELILQNPAATADEIAGLFNAQVPTPKVSDKSSFVTYVSIGTRRDLFGDDAGNMAGKLHDGLAAWAAAPDISSLAPGLPNPGYLSILHARLSGAIGLDLSDTSTPAMLGVLTSGIDAAHPPLLTADQAAALLSIGYDVVVPVTAEIVVAEKSRITREARRLRVVDAQIAACGALATAFDADSTITIDAMTAAFAAEFTTRMGA